jgi:riboflavin kinase/FMN adenylyltransferase
MGKEFGYQVEVLPPLKYDDEVVSSSRIRACLVERSVEQAMQLLGRPYQINGEVISGDGRGKTIGIPTANLSIWPKRALPDAGVYVCKARVNGGIWGAVTNIGVRPTFENQPVFQRVETHILDFDEDIYGQKVHLDFLSFIRAERRFEGIEALVEQIKKDISQARKDLSSE